MIGQNDEILGLTNRMILSAPAMSPVGICALLQRKGIASIGETADSLNDLVEQFPGDAGSFIVKERAKAMRAPSPTLTAVGRRRRKIPQLKELPLPRQRRA